MEIYLQINIYTLNDKKNELVLEGIYELLDDLVLVCTDKLVESKIIAFMKKIEMFKVNKENIGNEGVGIEGNVVVMDII